MITELADLLLGARCAGCGQPGPGLCAQCRTEFAEPAFRLRGGVAARGLPVWAAGHYGGAMSQVVSAHKDRGALGLTRVLAEPLVRSLEALLVPGAPPGVVLVVPVPSSPAAVRRRGFDHSRALARRAARVLRSHGHQVRVAPLLRRTVRVRDQSGLGRAERAVNQAHSMTARSCAGASPAVVVVDDLCTTGATLAEAHRALREAGWRVLGAAVVAHVDSSGERFGEHP